MAKATYTLINALRKSAEGLEQGSRYEWGHMGACNCGSLVQEISQLSKAEIHRYAMQKYGDWTEQSMDYCPQSTFPIDLLISELLAVGLEISDIKNLERLSDLQVLRQLPKHNRFLLRNKREHVIIYMKAWAQLLEEELLSKMQTPLPKAEMLAV